MSSHRSYYAYRGIFGSTIFISSIISMGLTFDLLLAWQTRQINFPMPCIFFSSTIMLLHSSQNINIFLSPLFLMWKKEGSRQRYTYFIFVIGFWSSKKNEGIIPIQSMFKLTFGVKHLLTTQYFFIDCSLSLCVVIWVNFYSG